MTWSLESGEDFALSHGCPCLAQENLDTISFDPEAPREAVLGCNPSSLRPRLKKKRGVLFHSTPEFHIEPHKGFVAFKTCLCQFGECITYLRLSITYLRLSRKSVDRREC